jgi:nucleotide-binding universal stress UspA family protein
MFRHLLVPVDGGPLSQRTMAASIGLARPLGAAITGFIVEPTAALPSHGHGAAGYVQRMQTHAAESAAHAEAVIESFRRLAEAAGVPFEGCFARSDQVVRAIIDAARERGCDLIVMATHVHGLLGELLATSNAKGVMARAGLPLLVLH